MATKTDKVYKTTRPIKGSGAYNRPASYHGSGFLLPRDLKKPNVGFRVYLFPDEEKQDL